MAEVDSSLVKQIEELLFAYKNFYNQHYIIKTQNSSHRPEDVRMELLEDLLENVQSQLIKSLQKLIPDVRALVKPSSDLSNLIKRYQESSFSVQNLGLCLKTIRGAPIRATHETLNQIINLAETKNLTMKKTDDQVLQPFLLHRV